MSGGGVEYLSDLGFTTFRLKLQREGPKFRAQKENFFSHGP